MTPFLLITAIIAYIISLALALVFAMMAPKLNIHFFKIFATIHFSFFILTITTIFIYINIKVANFLMIFTFCSGLILSGYALRKNIELKFLKYYFGAFLISLGLFFYAPSQLFYLISGSLGKYVSAQEFQLKENYYLVEQQSMLQLTATHRKYKIIQKFGIYNRTISRDLDFTDKLKQANLVLFNSDTIVIAGKAITDEIIVIGVNPGMNSNEITQKRK